MICDDLLLADFTGRETGSGDKRDVAVNRVVNQTLGNEVPDHCGFRQTVMIGIDTANGPSAPSPQAAGKSNTFDVDLEPRHSPITSRQHRRCSEFRPQGDGTRLFCHSRAENRGNRSACCMRIRSGRDDTAAGEIADGRQPGNASIEESEFVDFRWAVVAAADQIQLLASQPPSAP